MALRSTRNLTFLALVAVVGMSHGLSAWSDYDYFCQVWTSGYSCNCSGSGHHRQILCNFSDVAPEDPYELAMDLVAEQDVACEDYCTSDDYYWFLNDSLNLGKTYIWELRACIDTWGNPGGGYAEPQGWAECDCSYFAYCGT